MLRGAFEQKFWARLPTIQAAIPHLSRDASITLLGAITARAGIAGTAGIAAPSTRRTTLDACNEFLAVLDDRAKRRELSNLGVEEATESPLFARIAELGEEFEAGLLALLFDDPELRRWVREYLVF